MCLFLGDPPPSNKRGKKKAVCLVDSEQFVGGWSSQGFLGIRGTGYDVAASENALAARTGGGVCDGRFVVCKSRGRNIWQDPADPKQIQECHLHQCLAGCVLFVASHVTNMLAILQQLYMELGLGTLS